MKNKYCDTGLLTNEASVEFNFLNPLIEDLGYTGADVSCKESISEIAISTGRKKVLYKPDYVLKLGGIPNVVIDAKAPSEDIEKWESQCSSYCLELNRSFDYNPVQYFCISNGLKTSVYKWDNRTPLITLAFTEFVDGRALKTFFDILSKDRISEKADELRRSMDSAPFLYEPAALAELNDLFPKLHKLIWRLENKSPSAAFVELMKIIFVKIDKDKQLYKTLGSHPKPTYSDVVFSSYWVQNQTENVSPINDPLFTNLVNSLEKSIAAGQKKRIFEKTEEINLSPETIKKIVKEIEHTDFYAMEEDIQGRLFESFLDATVRGKDIGQFFTPRDVVSLMVDLADLKVSKESNDNVLDLCCGSGGFLISSMRTMLEKSKELVGLSSSERSALEDRIRRESVFGVDAGSDPAMYKIARINMHLHGDGGSKIYYANSLDKNFGLVGPEILENNLQLEELQKLVATGKKFDVILSNPPFSMAYSRDNPEQSSILNTYEIATEGKFEKKLLSSVMFIERYKDLIADDGRIFAITDDSVLSGDSYSRIRKYIRNNFIILGMISLPGDAFKRASARVKTSILILRKKKTSEEQPDIFGAVSCYLGIEKKTAKRIGMNPDDIARRKKEEHERIVAEYRQFTKGVGGSWVIPAGNINDRMDVKYCMNDRGRKKDSWEKNGYSITTLGRELKPQFNRSVPVEDDNAYQLLKVTYSGEVLEGDILRGDESSYSKLSQLKEWDILISNMGVGRGAVGIVPPFHSGKFVSNEYTILRAKSNTEAVFYTNLLRSEEILADILSCATGMNRGRIKWDIIAEVTVPVCDPDNKELLLLVNETERFWKFYEKYAGLKAKHEAIISSKYEVSGEDAHMRWLGFKPPD